MKKLIFKVSDPKEGSVAALIKEVNKMTCRIQIDIEKGYVIVENVNDLMIDTVIDLIDNNYTISGVDIDNDVENEGDAPNVETDEQPSVPTETITEPEVATKIIGPQSEDDLIIEKVEFENEYVEELINKLLRTAYWAMYRMNIPEKEIGEFIYTLINEISMRYNRKESIEFSVGDVVDCNYGMHLPGEINGYHVTAIVCNISNSGMVYLVPITKVQDNLSSHSYLTYVAPDDIKYDSVDYARGTALLDKGKYVRSERFNSVIGKTSKEFFTKVLNQLAVTFDFRETTIHENTFESSSNEAKIKRTNTKISGVEAELFNMFETAFNKLDSSKKVDEQLDSFLVDINMPKDEKMLRQSFVIACDIKKITYENVILELRKLYPNAKEDIIRTSLKENFKKWLEQYPELAKKFPRISLMTVLKLFAKKF